MKLVKTALAVVTLAAIGVVTLWEAESRTSPGPLHPVHARLDELQGGEGCVACHGQGGTGSLASACETCHEAIAAQRSERRGLHGTIDEAARCDRCHVEHHGAATALVDARVFALAGVEDLRRYDHSHVAGFGLTGAHLALQCQHCHPHAEREVLAAGERRFLGLEQTCTSCHEDPHRGELGADCASCHGQAIAFDRVGEFRHRRFVVDGAHAELACARCHAPKVDGQGGEFAIDRLRGTDPEPRACVACHGDAHGADRSGERLALAAATDCARCHDTRAFAGAEFDVAEHAAIGVVLTGAHARSTCTSCHAPERAERLHTERMAGRAVMEDCGGCHAPAHEPDGGALPLANAGDCARCHDTRAFAGTPFRVDEHRALGVGLVGRHAVAACTGCHTPERATRGAAATPAARASLLTRCTECHASPHTPAMSTTVAELRALAGDAACALCHDADAPRFRRPDARIDDELHARVGLPLVAPHAGLACEACHAPERAFAARYPARSANDCASCHADPHGAQFATAGRAGDCLRCHAETSFVPPRYDVDEHGKAAFRLEGAHRATPCHACHTKTDEAPRRFVGTPQDCAACHTDPHGGQFDLATKPRVVEGRSGCARCHDAASFASVRSDFDHALWTGHALLGKHARTACSDCHGRHERPDAKGRTLGTAARRCAECHADVHRGQFARGNPALTDCARCHDESRDFTALRFDHARDTRFPLDQAHAKLSCSACHTEQVLADGARVVRWRPLGVLCTDCHGGKEIRR